MEQVVRTSVNLPWEYARLQPLGRVLWKKWSIGLTHWSLMMRISVSGEDHLCTRNCKMSVFYNSSCCGRPYWPRGNLSQCCTITSIDNPLQWCHNGRGGVSRLTIVYSTVYSGGDQRKHQSSASLAFVLGIHRGPVNSQHKWPVTRKMAPFDDVIIPS